jgi:hypothetical protein
MVDGSWFMGKSDGTRCNYHNPSILEVISCSKNSTEKLEHSNSK